jgi:uncharacterized protein (DUF1800 family)
MLAFNAGKPDDPAWAWAPYTPDAKRPWTLRWAGHLVRRAGFGATADQLQAALADGPQRTVDKLLQGGDAAALNRTLDEYETWATASEGSAAAPLRPWWLRRMIQTPHPLLEKMCLFWHGYFAVGNARVQDGRQMREYFYLLRSQALGRFSTLLAGVMRTPATVVSADLGLAPPSPLNENLARLLLAHYGVGQGQFSPEDLKQTARAMTGWLVTRGTPRYLAHRHDAGAKTIFGHSGAWAGDDAVRLCLQQPATPRRVVRKLYAWLVSETDAPSDALLAPLAEAFAKGYDVARLVETILRSNRFYSEAAYRQRVKSPIELAVGLVRCLESIVPTVPLDTAIVGLGQDLCQPPTVEGWVGGRAWIDERTLVARANLAFALLSGHEPYGAKVDPLDVARRHGRATADAAAKFFVDLLLQGDVAPAVRDALPKLPAAGDTAAQAVAMRSLVAQIVALPEFRLA